MTLNPLVIAAAVVVGLILFSKDSGIPNPFNPANAKTSAPGAAAQQAGNVPAGQGVTGFNPNDKGVSPNSTLATVNSSIVVANNALGFLDKLGSYFGDNNDSEYPVASADYTPAATDDYLGLDSNYLA